jgi:hypothetical protein
MGEKGNAYGLVVGRSEDKRHLEDLVMEWRNVTR